MYWGYSIGGIMRFSIALACALVCAAPAAAAPQGKPPADESYSYFSTDAGLLTAANGGGTATTLELSFGYQIDRHYAVEGGYAGVFVQGASANGGYVDLFGFLPLGRHSRVSLFSTVGASYVSSVVLGSTIYSASAFGVRAGGGIEWHLSDKWAVRGALRYENTIVDSTVASLGFVVRF